MKRLLFLLLAAFMLISASSLLAEGARFQVAACSFITAGADNEKPIINMRFGVSQKLADVGVSGALYGAALGRYGASGDINGGGLELAYFPIAPSTGLRIFFPIGTNVTALDLGEDPITYWQAASGIGVYWDFADATAAWLAARAEMSEDLTTLDVGLGLSIAIQ